MSQIETGNRMAGYNAGKWSRWQRWTLSFVIWTIIGLSFGLRSYFTALLNGTRVNWLHTGSGFLVDFYVWGLVSPLIFWLARRFPIERGNLRIQIPLHILFCAVFIFCVNAISIPAYWYLGFPDVKTYPTLASMFEQLVASPFMIHQGLLVYWGTLTTAHAVEYYRQLQAGKIRTAELTSQLAQAQLSALKMQIHPHFLFNTLNSIAALLHKDVEAADKMIARLSDFLRITLKSSNTTTATLQQEIEFLKAYLDIEKIRFPHRLSVEMKIEPETLDARVPNLILQPIIENAVKHGIARNVSRGLLIVTAAKENDRLVISIEDNGPGLNGNGNLSARSNGVGLTNTRERLNRFYDGDFDFEIRNDPNHRGTIVNLKMPYLN